MGQRSGGGPSRLGLGGGRILRVTADPGPHAGQTTRAWIGEREGEVCGRPSSPPMLRVEDLGRRPGYRMGVAQRYPREASIMRHHTAPGSCRSRRFLEAITRARYRSHFLPQRLLHAGGDGKPPAVAYEWPSGSIMRVTSRAPRSHCPVSSRAFRPLPRSEVSGFHPGSGGIVRSQVSIRRDPWTVAVLEALAPRPSTAAPSGVLRSVHETSEALAMARKPVDEGWGRHRLPRLRFTLCTSIRFLAAPLRLAGPGGGSIVRTRSTATACGGSNDRRPPSTPPPSCSNGLTPRPRLASDNFRWMEAIRLGAILETVAAVVRLPEGRRVCIAEGRPGRLLRVLASPHRFSHPVWQAEPSTPRGPTPCPGSFAGPDRADGGPSGCNPSALTQLSLA